MAVPQPDRRRHRAGEPPSTPLTLAAAALTDRAETMGRTGALMLLTAGVAVSTISGPPAAGAVARDLDEWITGLADTSASVRDADQRLTAHAPDVRSPSLTQVGRNDPLTTGWARA
jgi:hypothetical protein